LPRLLNKSRKALFERLGLFNPAARSDHFKATAIEGMAGTPECSKGRPRLRSIQYHRWQRQRLRCARPCPCHSDTGPVGERLSGNRLGVYRTDMSPSRVR
jgi:hypothetical protein